MSAIVLPDYNDCILNTMSSILKYYGASSSYSAIDALDNALSKDYTNIVLMIFDGMGTDMLKNNLPENSFLRSNLVKEIKSVYPCTTTAALTSYYSGLSPNEHGWLGWSLYFKEYGRFIDAFTNQDSFTGETLGEKHAAYTLMPYETVYEKIDNATAGKTKIYTIIPSGITFPEGPDINVKVDSSGQLCKEIRSLCDGSGRKFIMSYWPEPDMTMHIHGCYAEQTKAQIGLINRQVEEMCKDLKDTVVIISADHGLVNIDRDVYLDTIPEINECLMMPPSIEPRAVSFFIKPEMKPVFEELFNKMLGGCFRLYRKEEVMQGNLFGYGVQHKKVSDFTGDYLACATGSTILRYKTVNSLEKYQYKAHHAGLRAEEMLVPLIILSYAGV